MCDLFERKKIRFLKIKKCTINEHDATIENCAVNH